jgi:hypothetical protein
MLPVLLTRERAIIRQSSLAQAVNFTSQTPGDDWTTDRIILIAREFEAYASGDMDIEAAKKSLSAEDLDGATD